MTHTKVGLLPLYLELYDRLLPDARGPLEEFYETIASELGIRGLDIVRVPVCRLRSEFADAVRSFERSGATAIITLHLAYSPSLESADVLAATKLPIIVLDTTPDESFGPMQDPALLMNNHGVHGVQDMCNLLRRRSKAFIIEAGHWHASDVLDRVCAHATSRAAASPQVEAGKTAPQGTGNNTPRLAAAMKQSRVGRIGNAFRGMGDFQVQEDVLRSAVGAQVVPIAFEVLRAMMPTADDAAVIAEMARDREAFAAAAGLDAKAHAASVRVSLAVRRWIEREGLTAFTVNFDEIGKDSGLPAVPFLEASKAMSRGIGYAGEGDALTAGFVGALASVFPETTFTEIFCPDWIDNTIFLSHMAEMNVALCAEKPTLMLKPMPWMELSEPVVALGRFKGGEAAFVNLAPAPRDRFTLIVARVSMLDVKEDRMPDMVRGWMRPAVPIARFLETYSRHGGTHHAALVYGNVADDLAAFGQLMGWDVVQIS